MFDLKKRVGYILAFLFLFLLPFTVFAEGKDIIILHTNDIHCGVSDNLGIDKVAQYKKELQKIQKRAAEKRAPRCAGGCGRRRSGNSSGQTFKR